MDAAIGWRGASRSPTGYTYMRSIVALLPAARLYIFVCYSSARATRVRAARWWAAGRYRVVAQLGLLVRICTTPDPRPLSAEVELLVQRGFGVKPGPNKDAGPRTTSEVQRQALGGSPPRRDPAGPMPSRGRVVCEEVWTGSRVTFLDLRAQASASLGLRGRYVPPRRTAPSSRRPRIWSGPSNFSAPFVRSVSPT